MFIAKNAEKRKLEERFVHYGICVFKKNNIFEDYFIILGEE